MHTWWYEIKNYEYTIYMTRYVQDNDLINGSNF